MIALEILKLQLNDFFERSNQQTLLKTIKKEEMYFNKSLFELEHHLFKLKEDYNFQPSSEVQTSGTYIYL